MTTTTIKVSNETKQLLDMLQAKITLTLRKKKTLSELIDDITQTALRHEDELLQAEKTTFTDKSDMGRGRQEEAKHPGNSGNSEKSTQASI